MINIIITFLAYFEYGFPTNIWLRLFVSNNIKTKTDPRPNLDNLSHGLNLRRDSNMISSILNCIQCIKILVGAQWKPVLADLRHGSNSLRKTRF